MGVLQCPCGNTTRWRNLSTGPAGTRADCGACGEHVDRPDVTSSIQVNVARTDSAVVGDGTTQVNRF